jgi:hypothetical protein
MSLDGSLIWFAAVLLLAALASGLVAAGTRGEVRAYLRFAAALAAALALAAGFDIAPVAVAPISATLGAALLAFAVYASFRRSPPPRFAAGALALAALAGIAAAFTGETVLAIVPQLVCILALFGISRRGLRRLRAPSIQLAAGAAALLAGVAVQAALSGAGMMALLLFWAAGLLGVTLSVARISDTFVKLRRRLGAGAAVGPLR